MRPLRRRDAAAGRDRAAAAPRTGRGAEAGLLLLAVAVVVLAYLAVEAGARDGEVSTSVVPYALGLGGLLGAAHVAVRRLARFADPVLLPCVALLNGLGLVVIHRLDLAEEARAVRLGEAVPSADAAPQLVWTALGVAVFVAVLALVRDHTSLSLYTFTAGALTVLLLLSPLVPGLGREINGARIWLRLGPLSFQPGEVAKITLIVFFAGYLAANRDTLTLVARRVGPLTVPRARDLGPLVLVWAASLGVLVFQQDLGTSLLYFALFVTMLYVATERTSWLLFGAVLFVAGAYGAYLVVARVTSRVDVWLDPLNPAYTDDQSYQLSQGLFGLGTGGLLGTGLGAGRPDVVPFAKTDFIADAVGEELGLVGLTALLVVYLLVVTRGLRAALSVRDGFGKLLAAGLSASLAVQTFVVVGGVTGLVPLTGLTTPFLSYGGSSLVANYAIVALLLRVSHAARRPAEDPPGPARAGGDEQVTDVVRPVAEPRP